VLVFFLLVLLTVPDESVKLKKKFVAGCNQ